MVGFDFVALAALAEGQGCPPAVFADLFAGIEAAAVAALNQTLEVEPDD